MSAASDAIDAAFEDDTVSKAARWYAGGAGAGTQCRVILGTPDLLTTSGELRTVRRAVLVRVRKSEIASPHWSDTGAVDEVSIDETAARYRLISEPMLDESALTWRAEATPVA